MRRILWQSDQGRRFNAMVLWEPRDLWVGVYWTREELYEGWLLRVYVCVLPCFPLALRWEPVGMVPF